MIAVDTPIGVERLTTSYNPSLIPMERCVTPSERRQDVSTTLSYHVALTDEEPYQYIRDPPEGVARHNLGHDIRPLVVKDLRGVESLTNLDEMGFKYMRHVSQEREFDDEERIKAVYYHELEEIIKRETGAKRIIFLEHTIRRNYVGKEGVHTNAPLHRVHVDQSFEAAVKRVHRHTGEEAERYLRSRVRIINVWKPIRNTVYNDPLAVMDARSLSLSALVPIKFFFPGREGAVYGVKYDDKQRWFYLRHQTPEEIVLFKCYDSREEEGVARCCPHTAFRDDSAPISAPKRESIEVRVLVLDDE